MFFPLKRMPLRGHYSVLSISPHVNFCTLTPGSRFPDPRFPAPLRSGAIQYGHADTSAVIDHVTDGEGPIWTAHVRNHFLLRGFVCAGASGSFSPSSVISFVASSHSTRLPLTTSGCV